MLTKTNDTLSVLFLCSFILICILVTMVRDCDIPIVLIQLYKTPIKFHKATCPTSAVDKSINSEMNHSGIDKTIPRYVVNDLIGERIGNLLFQTASTFGIAATLTYRTYIDASHPLLPYFEMSASTHMDLTNNIVLTEEECMAMSQGNIFSQYNCGGMASILEIFSSYCSHNITVEGWKYFHHIAPTI